MPLPRIAQKDTRANTSTIATNTKEDKFHRIKTRRLTRLAQGSFSKENSREEILRLLVEVIMIQMRDNSCTRFRDGRLKKGVIIIKDQIRKVTRVLNFSQTKLSDNLPLHKELTLWLKRKNSRHLKIFQKRQSKTRTGL